MKNDYCIIKVYAATSNEYVVKSNLTFDEAQEEFERFNNLPSGDEPCMYIIGDGVGDLDHIEDSTILDQDDEDDYDTLDSAYFGRLVRGEHLNNRFLENI